MRFRRQEGAGISADPGSPSSWPVIDPTDAQLLQDLIEAFEAAPTIEATEIPARALAKLSDSAGWDDNKSIWIWFVQWSERAPGLGLPMIAVKIAEFTQTFHERFVPASGRGAYLNKATDEQREAIERAALVACADLDPGISVRADMELPVGVFRNYLAERLGNPADGLEH